MISAGKLERESFEIRVCGVSRAVFAKGKLSEHGIPHTLVENKKPS